MAFPRQLRQAAAALVQIEFWVVGGMVVLSVAMPRFLTAAVITAAVFLPLRKVACGRFSVHTWADAGIVALALISLANLWVTPVPEITLPQVLRLWSGFGLFYAVANWADRQNRLRRLLQVVMVAGLGLALAAPFSVTWPTGKMPFVPAELYDHFQVLVADSIHPNVLGGTLALVLPVVLGTLLFIHPSPAWERLLAILSAAGVAGALVISLSRGAIMASGLAVIVLLILRGRWGWMALSIAAAGVGFAALRYGTSRVIDLLLAGGAAGGWSGRIEIWTRAFYMLQDFPFTGVGMGVFGTAADRLYPFTYYGPGSIHHAHNLFLQVAVDLGIPGLLAWLAVLAAGISAAWQAYASGRNNDPVLRGMGAGLLAAQAALIAHGLMDAVTWGMVRPAPLVWLLWGMAEAARVAGKNHRQQSSE